MKYNVLKNFQDKHTKQYFGMGATYETDDAERAAELERGGFIVLAETQETQAVKMDETTKKTNQASAKVENKTKAVDTQAARTRQTHTAKAAQEAQEVEKAAQQATQEAQKAVQKAAQQEAQQAAQQAQAKTKQVKGTEEK